MVCSHTLCFSRRQTGEVLTFLGLTIVNAAQDIFSHPRRISKSSQAKANILGLEDIMQFIQKVSHWDLLNPILMLGSDYMIGLMAPTRQLVAPGTKTSIECFACFIPSSLVTLTQHRGSLATFWQKKDSWHSFFVSYHPIWQLLQEVIMMRMIAEWRCRHIGQLCQPSTPIFTVTVAKKQVKKILCSLIPTLKGFIQIH